MKKYKVLKTARIILIIIGITLLLWASFWYIAILLSPEKLRSVVLFVFGLYSLVIYLVITIAILVISEIVNVIKKRK
jgi:hypothetical protein